MWDDQRQAFDRTHLGSEFRRHSDVEAGKRREARDDLQRLIAHLSPNKDLGFGV